MADDVDLGELPPELADRIRAATAHADFRSIRRNDDGGVAVYAHADDRVVVMELRLRSDHSVAETTHAFVAADVVAATTAGSDGELDVVIAGERRHITVPAALAQRVRH